MAERPKPDDAQPDEMSKADEEALLAELRDLLQRVDSMPDEVRADGEAAGRSLTPPLNRKRRRD